MLNRPRKTIDLASDYPEHLKALRDVNFEVLPVALKLHQEWPKKQALTAGGI